MDSIKNNYPNFILKTFLIDSNIKKENEKIKNDDLKNGGIDELKKYSQDSYVILTSDGYDLERKECRDLFDFQVYPLCYHAAKGIIFSELLEIDDCFEDFVNMVININITNKKEWYSDEIYLSSMINSKYGNYEFHKLKRGYQDNFYLPNRIEKYNFPVDFRDNEEMRLTNLKVGNYDKQKLVDGYYIDCHCVRPYGWYDKEIWEVANTIINKNSDRMNDLIMVTAFCDTKEKEETLRNLVNQISTNKDRFDLMVISHSVIPDDIVEKCDYHSLISRLFEEEKQMLTDAMMYAFDEDGHTGTWKHDVINKYYDKIK
jgi:hypothetical protein